ncbi:hypothetical protein HY57_16350 [Dyella japonica A8]|uniref:Uncharacterized protein n=2 Tax=Dyella japonica TaxID=231455 RepID=A0A075K380_9GAMM|nr:hypothetical protein HY57_16350 [Dyella japonica A8]
MARWFAWVTTTLASRYHFDTFTTAKSDVCEPRWFDAATHSDEPDVKAFASWTLTTLRDQMEMAGALTPHQPLGAP